MKLRDRIYAAIMVVLSNPNHFLMWGASAALTVILFLELASGSPLYQVIFGCIGYSFDYTKDKLWRRSIISKKHVGAYRFIACGFAFFSFMATAGAGLAVAEKFDTASKRVDVVSVVSALDADIKGAEDDIKALVAERDALPADYATARMKYQDSIDRLKARATDMKLRRADAKADADAPKSASSKRMFELVSAKLGWNITTVIFVFFLIFGAWLEIGNFATAPEYDRGEPAPVQPPAAGPRPVAPRPATIPRPIPRPSPEPVRTEPATVRPASPPPSPVVSGPGMTLPESVLRSEAPKKKQVIGPSLFDTEV